MQKVIRKLPQIKPLEAPKRVAAYARVSSDKFTMVMSLAAQVSYYTDLIQNKKNCVFVGVYADEGITGTRADRPEFQRLLEDCRAGKIDAVITKSTTRFARNTVVLLETVRELKALGIDVFFEKENLHTLSSDGELLITILASYAQEESRSASENQKWRVKKNFENGLPWNTTLYGYRIKDGQFVVYPEEAEVVKMIFSDYLSGLGNQAIANKLTEQGIRPMFAEQWNKSSIRWILCNYNYTGNLLLQKTFSEDHISKQRKENKGEMPMYHAEGSHEPIVSKEIFAAVQEERAKRAKAHYRPTKSKTNLFTGLIVCGTCGKHYIKKQAKTQVIWSCITFTFKGKVSCASKSIPETTLKDLAADVLGVEITADILREQLDCIVAENGNRIIFCFKDGRREERQWKDRSRSESWTPEMREQARQRILQRRIASDG